MYNIHIKFSKNPSNVYILNVNYILLCYTEYKKKNIFE